MNVMNDLFGELLGSHPVPAHHHSSPNHRQLDQSNLYKMLAESPTGVVYSYGITWTKRDGTVCTTSGTGYYEREVRKQVLRSVIRQGWTYPRWWQWWRWDDTRPDLDFTRISHD